MSDESLHKDEWQKFKIDCLKVKFGNTDQTIQDMQNMQKKYTDLIKSGNLWAKRYDAELRSMERSRIGTYSEVWSHHFAQGFSDVNAGGNLNKGNTDHLGMYREANAIKQK